MTNFSFQKDHLKHSEIKIYRCKWHFILYTCRRSLLIESKVVSSTKFFLNDIKFTVLFSFQILVQDENPGVEYEYTLPQPHDHKEEGHTTQRPDNYTWSLSVSSCSEQCAGGMYMYMYIYVYTHNRWKNYH